MPFIDALLFIIICQFVIIVSIYLLSLMVSFLIRNPMPSPQAASQQYPRIAGRSQS